MSTTTTNGIKIEVTPQYLTEESDPSKRFWMYIYHVRIVNHSSQRVQLLNRHWVITNGLGEVQEVRGVGVVGQQPTLAPTQSFAYTSGCPLDTSVGSMHGSYTFVDQDGNLFEAQIDPFILEDPAHSN